MGGASSTYGGEVHIGFWWESLKEKTASTWKTYASMEDNINMDFQDVAWGYGLNWSGLGEEKVVDYC